jgi:hypothetical protein
MIGTETGRRSELGRLVQRVRGLLSEPRAEWQVIAAEPTDFARLFRGYIVPLAALPPAAALVRNTVIGVPLPFGRYREGLLTALAGFVAAWLLALAVVYVLSLVVRGLARSFGGQGSAVQALKTIGYAYTATWLAGLGLLLPAGFSLLVVLAGFAFSIYLLWLGLQAAMQVPAQRAIGCTLVTVIAAVALAWAISALSMLAVEAAGGLPGIGVNRPFGEM